MKRDDDNEYSMFKIQLTPVIFHKVAAGTVRRSRLGAYGLVLKRITWHARVRRPENIVLHASYIEFGGDVVESYRVKNAISVVYPFRRKKLDAFLIAGDHVSRADRRPRETAVLM